MIKQFDQTEVTTDFQAIETADTRKELGSLAEFIEAKGLKSYEVRKAKSGALVYFIKAGSANYVFTVSENAHNAIQDGDTESVAVVVKTITNQVTGMAQKINRLEMKSSNALESVSFGSF